MFVTGSYRTNKSALGGGWCAPDEEPGLAFSWWYPQWLQSFVTSSSSVKQCVGAGLEASATSVGSEGSPLLSCLAETTGGVRGFCSSRNGRSPKERIAPAVSEHLLVLVSYQLHLGCSSLNTSIQLGTATLCGIDFWGSRVTNGGMQFLVGHERWLLYCCWVITSSYKICLWQWRFNLGVTDLWDCTSDVCSNLCTGCSKWLHGEYFPGYKCAIYYKYIMLI